MKLENRMLFASTLLLSTLLVPSLFGSTRPPETDGSTRPVVIQNKTGREIYLRTKSLAAEGLKKGTFEAEKTKVDQLAPSAEIAVERPRFVKGFSISGWLGEPDKSERIFGIRGNAVKFAGLKRIEILAGKTDHEFRLILEFDCTGLECPICLDKLKTSEIISITDCNHKFHKYCLDPLIEQINRHEKTNACPICREPLHSITATPVHYNEILYMRNGNVINHSIEPIRTSEQTTY